jgi:hypothetical protein
MDSGAYFSGSDGPEFVEVASALFPTGRAESLSQGDTNDVMHLLAHHAADGDIFVTNNTRDFVANGRRERLRERWGIVVMTPAETVEHLARVDGVT